MDITDDPGHTGRTGRNAFTSQLHEHVSRASIPIRRLATLARLPHQTLHNWLGGARPRWHPRLAEELRRLGGALGLSAADQRKLEAAARCSPVAQFPTTQEALIMTGTSTESALPKGWCSSGKAPAAYQMGVEAQPAGESPAAFIRARAEPDDFATLMQQFGAGSFRGRRVRFAARVKVQGVSDWAALWMRVDRPDGTSPSFDNMQNRPLAGTRDWERHEVVLDVPDDASMIALGVLLDGPGQVWIRDASFEIVGTDVPSTNMYGDTPDRPVNLDFSA